MWSGDLDPFAHVIVLILMLVMGIQDLRTRHVSNWITIPFFFVGLIANALRAFSDVFLFQFILFCQAVVFFAGYHGWMGGADMKVFVGLLGLFPLAGGISLIASGIWGAAVWMWTGNRKAKFPAVTIIAITTILITPISLELGL
jgi:Flp pilus assembly protein protease CpaA